MMYVPFGDVVGAAVQGGVPAAIELINRWSRRADTWVDEAVEELPNRVAEVTSEWTSGELGFGEIGEVHFDVNLQLNVTLATQVGRRARLLEGGPRSRADLAARMGASTRTRQRHASASATPAPRGCPQPTPVTPVLPPAPSP